MNLNGIGTWRGRNAILCLNVLNGEYDALLPWPCTLSATITLRDQPDENVAAIDYIKTLVTKKKNQDFDRHQYIHIPHDVLKMYNYIKNNAMFIEVKINKNM